MHVNQKKTIYEGGKRHETHGMQQIVTSKIWNFSSPFVYHREPNINRFYQQGIRAQFPETSIYIEWGKGTFIYLLLEGESLFIEPDGLLRMMVLDKTMVY